MRYTQSLVYLAFHVTSTARGKNVPVGIINMLRFSNVLICSSVNRMFTVTQNNNINFDNRQVNQKQSVN